MWIVTATAVLIGITGCRTPPNDLLLTSVVSPDGDYRATVIQRTYRNTFRSGDTYVLVRKGRSAYNYPAGADFPDAQIALAMPQCGPLKLEWRDNLTLQVTCDKCGRFLKDADQHVDKLGDVQILYSGFAGNGTSP